MMRYGLRALFLVSSIALLPAANGQSSLAPSVEPEHWQELSPDTRHEMRREYLKSLAPNEREKLRMQVQRFNALPSSKKQELCRRFQKDRGYLPPACQKLF